MPSPLDPPPWLGERRRAIGDQIREVREERGLSQERLGHLAGIGRVTMNRIEQGHAAPTLDTLLVIADALATPLSDLVRDIE